jgi:hypothetical protein
MGGFDFLPVYFACKKAIRKGQNRYFEECKSNGLHGMLTFADSKGRWSILNNK